MKEQESSSVILRACTPRDVASIRQIVSVLQPLDQHSTFTYWVLFQYFSELCHVACDSGDRVVGFVSGVRSASDGSLGYLWQIGVLPEARGAHLAVRLIIEFLNKARALGIRRLQYSIDPENNPSMMLAQKLTVATQVVPRRVDRLEFIDPVEGGRTTELLFEIELAGLDTSLIRLDLRNSTR